MLPTGGTGMPAASMCNGMAGGNGMLNMGGMGLNAGMGGMASGMSPMGMGMPMVPMGMGMAIGMGMPMMPMGMGMGMPMMGMMGMPAMPMMTPMMAATMSGANNMAAMQAMCAMQGQQAQPLQHAVAQDATPPVPPPPPAAPGATGDPTVPALQNSAADTAGFPGSGFAGADPSGLVPAQTPPGAGALVPGLLSEVAAADERNKASAWLAAREAEDRAKAREGEEKKPMTPSENVTEEKRNQEEEDEETLDKETSGPQPCHLHSQKKPNAKCKFCQRSMAASTQSSTAQRQSKSRASDGARHAPEDYSKRTFNCSPMLKDQIFSSTYFKNLLTITSLEDLVEEIAKYAETLDVYNPGSQTSPSCFAAQVYRLFTLPQAEDLGEIQYIIDYPDSAVVRCAGFLYMRFVVAPVNLWDKLEEYLFDTMPLSYSHGGNQFNLTIGDYVESLLVKDKYFGTPLPRIPVKVKLALEKELAPIQQYRKRMEANLNSFPQGRRLPKLAVEVWHEGEWVTGVAKEYCGRTTMRRRIRVKLGNGGTIAIHLGKVVLRDKAPSKDVDESADSGDEGGRRKRSRSRGRDQVDWSRYKGQDDAEELVHALREKQKEDAVCVIGHGHGYSRRPLTVEEELWRREPENRVSLLGDAERGGSGSRHTTQGRESPAESEGMKKMRREEEEERRRIQRNIMEKYTAAPQAGAAKIATQKDVDGPDVLRFG